MVGVVVSSCIVGGAGRVPDGRRGPVARVAGSHFFALAFANLSLSDGEILSHRYNKTRELPGNARDQHETQPSFTAMNSAFHQGALREALITNVQAISGQSQKERLSYKLG